MRLYHTHTAVSRKFCREDAKEPGKVHLTGFLVNCGIQLLQSSSQEKNILVQLRQCFIVRDKPEDGKTTFNGASQRINIKLRTY